MTELDANWRGRFVSRAEDGKITGSYAQLQPGYAEEPLAFDNPELVAFDEAAQRSLAGAPSSLALYAANKRWQREIGGTPWSGHVVATDRESQTKLLAEFVAISAGLRSDPSPWKFSGGEFAMLSNAEMTDVIVAARSHIAASFAIEAAVLAAIATGTVTSTEQIDAWFD